MISHTESHTKEKALTAKRHKCLIYLVGLEGLEPSAN